MAQTLSHTVVTYPEPHVQRTRQILKAHPEVTKLFGHQPTTALFVLLVVGIQIAVAWALTVADAPWWGILLASYTVGSIANHALWTLIHEATHNLIFKAAWANQVIAIVANFPIVFPSAISFRTYHIKHHIYQGDFDRDADLARPFEAALVGSSTWRKALWLLLFPVGQIARVPFLKGIPFVTPWTAANWVAQFSFLAIIGFWLGPVALAYLGLCSLFSIGLHPVGARWIQEHYTVKPGQETYSYYGPLNLVAFNVGYHNEHHDLMRVAWSRLPRVRAIAPEFYDTLHYHTSWTGLFFRFLFDPSITLYSRVVRGETAQALSRRPAAATVEEVIARSGTAASA